MNLIKPDVSTICIGMAASCGSMTLVAGAKGKRYILPNAEVMIHQPSGGAKGMASDIEIRAKHIQKTKKKLAQFMVDRTGQTLKQIEKDMDRDTWFDAEESVKYGLVDKIIESQSSIPTSK
jgi:ATP-dependent Clp protease protease subunit